MSKEGLIKDLDFYTDKLRQTVIEVWPEPTRETSNAMTRLDEFIMWINTQLQIDAQQEQVQYESDNQDTGAEVLPTVPVSAESVATKEEREV